MTNESQLVDYLLGRLRDPDAERLDEASVVDDGVAARLRAVEDDLVDAYVRGALRGDVRECFEARYLSSPIRREKVAFARRFVQAVDRAASVAPPVTAPAVVRRRGWKLSLVAAVLVAAGSAALLRVSVRRADEIVVRPRQDAFDRQVQDAQRAGAEVRGARITTDAQKPASRRAAAASADAAAIALVLPPQTRAAGPVPALSVPAQTSRIRFELRLDAGGRGTYVVGLRDPAVNRIVWRTRSTSTDDGALTVWVPAAILKPQHYSLDVFADGVASGADVRGSFAFEIASR